MNPIMVLFIMEVNSNLGQPDIVFNLKSCNYIDVYISKRRVFSIIASGKVEFTAPPEHIDPSPDAQSPYKIAITRTRDEDDHIRIYIKRRYRKVKYIE